MAEFSDKPPYIKQIALYFQQGDYQKSLFTLRRICAKISRGYALPFPFGKKRHFGLMILKQAKKRRPPGI